MNNKDAIIDATISLINEKENHMGEITMRQISSRAGVGLGLINYHFGNKEKLIEVCVEKIVNNIVENFHKVVQQTKGLTPFEALDYLGNMTLTFLFDHQAISRISITSDMSFPTENDNTHRTIEAYIPLVAQCRPDWDDALVHDMAFCLISTMQSSFLRYEILFKQRGINLKDPQERKEYHTKMLNNTIGIQNPGIEVNRI